MILVRTLIPCTSQVIVSPSATLMFSAISRSSEISNTESPRVGAPNQCPERIFSVGTIVSRYVERYSRLSAQYCGESPAARAYAGTGCPLISRFSARGNSCPQQRLNRLQGR